MNIREEKKYDFDLTQKKIRQLKNHINSLCTQAIFYLKRGNIELLLETAGTKGLTLINQNISICSADPEISTSEEKATQKFLELW